MSTPRCAVLVRRILVILLVPSLAFGQIPPAAQETLDQLQNTPGLSINTAPDCCPPPSIWDHLGIHQIEEKIHATKDQLAQLPLIQGLCQTLQTALGAMGLAPSPADQSGLPGAPGAEGAAPGAGGGAAGAIAQKIEADKQAADDKVATLEYLGQQDCNAYPEIVPALLEALDDPIERVRYAALVALQRQCRDLRCSTLPATRLDYRLHGQVFIDHCRQCASCACQQQVIKRLSDLLLDETALGYPKENSPRVRSLAAAILERCLQVHPVEPETPQTQGVQPDPMPTPVPDPQASATRAAAQARFPAVPLFQRRSREGNKGWWRRMLGLRDQRGGAGRPNSVVEATIFRGQSPDVMFSAKPEEEFETRSTWKPASDSTATLGFDSADDVSESSGDDLPLSPYDLAGAGEGEEPVPMAAGTDDAYARAMRTQLLLKTVSEAESAIRATASDREGASRQQFNDAVAALGSARLALALDGDQQQADSLYADAAELCANLPNTTPALIALDAVTRYYAATSGEATADGQTALQRYAAFLGYRMEAFDDVPANVAWDLYQAARRLHRAGLTAEAARGLRQIIEYSPQHAIAAESADLLAAIESQSGSDVELAAGRQATAIASGMAGFNGRSPEPAQVSSTASTAAHAESSQSPADAAEDDRADVVDQLHRIVDESEQSARAAFSDRQGAGAEAFESALSELCEARLQLALLGDEKQFRELNDDARGLCSQDPNSRGAEIAMQALTRYFKARAGEETEQSQKALRHYASCLQYFLENIDSVPPDAAPELLAAANALWRIGSDELAIASLQSILDRCSGTSVADQAGVLLAEFEAHPESATAMAQEAPQDSPGELTEDRQWLNQSLVEAETAVWAAFDERLGARKQEFESALERLCETRLQLALQGDQDQFNALYDDAETMCKEAPTSASAEIAMDALTAYYQAHAGETTADEQDSLRRYAGCLRYRVARFQSFPEESAQALLAAGDALHRCGLSEDAALCYRSVAKSPAGGELASVAATRLQSASASPKKIPSQSSPASETVKSRDRQPKSDVVAADAEARSLSDSAIASTSGSNDSATHPSDDAPLMLGSVVNPTSSLSAPPPPAPPADAPPPLPFDAAPGTTAAELRPIEDPFGPNPLEEDVVDRAQRALEANEFAYLHLQEEDNIVERYNNSVGVEMAPYSLFHIVGAEPGNVFKLRYSSVYGYDRPDRSEYFWKRIGSGGPPLAETGLNYQQLLVYQELSSGMASVFNEYPIYLLDPDQNSNTAGPGDLVIGLKAVMIKDENWTVTSVSKTYTPVGSPHAGLGRGHLALEQGVAIQLRAGRQTFVFSDLRFHYPIGASPLYGGELLIGGFGFSRIVWTDPIAPPIGRSRALLLTGETVITSFLDGKFTEPGAIAPADAEMTSVIQNLGLRAIWTKRFSTGTSIGFPLSASHLHNFSFLFEMQWVH